MLSSRHYEIPMKFIIAAAAALLLASAPAVGKEYPFERAKWDCNRDTGPGSITERYLAAQKLEPDSNRSTRSLLIYSRSTSVRPKPVKPSIRRRASRPSTSARRPRNGPALRLS
jgi:hypothetical protein